MFNKIFKSNEAEPVTAQATAADPSDQTDWLAKLHAAGGDEQALLAIAMDRDNAPLKIRQAAVEAMQSEDALKAAEREFRDHDRRIHREAKLRLETVVARRLARALADQLIADAHALFAQAHIPANRFVEIDRGWQALDAALLDSAQIAGFDTVSTQIAQVLRSRGDQQSLIKRWTHEADLALAELQAGSIAVAETGLERDKLAAAYDAVNLARENAPLMTDQDARSRDINHKIMLLDAALQLARALDARLTHIDKLAADATNANDDPAAWHGLPPVADTKIAGLLSARHDAIRRTRQQSRDVMSRAAKEAVDEKDKARRQAKLATLNELLTGAESALATGQVVDAAAALTTIEATLKGAHANPKLLGRVDALRAEITRLKGWQHWGGGRAREDLAAEAETLAKAITDEKLHIKSHADAIEKLRERWKELDKLGGATSRDLWGKFDGALKTAYLPVSAQLAKLKAVRQENLAARNQLITALDAVSVTADAASTAATLRDWARALEHFQTEWRKLGPVEHTVPHKAQAALLERMKAAMARLESPLNDSRRVEALKREQLIARAKALSTDSQQRDTIIKVRELQTEWQQHAKALPLQRNVENRLWAEFKAATDAIFHARDAANSARDAVFQTNATLRTELINKLTALTADTPPGEIKRTIAEVDSAWRRAGEAPRALEAKLEARFRRARDDAQQFSAGSAKRTWQKTCESLHAKLALCVELENNTGNVGNTRESWQALPALADIWEKPLHTRFDAALVGQPVSVPQDETLLKLEAALDMESPPAFQAARREMKLRAMKNAIEARQAVTVTNADIEKWIAVVIAAPLGDAVAAARLQNILAALPGKPLR